MGHITQPKSVFVVNAMATMVGDVQYLQFMGQLPTPPRRGSRMERSLGSKKKEPGEFCRGSWLTQEYFQCLIMFDKVL